MIRAMAKVLIVEDDDVIADGMAKHLSAAGFDAVAVGRGRAGLSRLRYEQPDVLVLDLMLPELDGWEVIEAARREGIGTPIVVVSARGAEEDRVRALNMGADDYLVKPFAMDELVARVRAAARRGARAETIERGDAIEVEELRIDPASCRRSSTGKRGADADGVPAALRARVGARPGADAGRAPPAALGRRQSYRDRTVDVFVRKLRDKIDRRAARHSFIQTRYGVGYRFEAEPKQ